MAETINRYNDIVAAGDFLNPNNAEDSDNTYSEREVPKLQFGESDIDNRLEGLATITVVGEYGLGTITKVELGIEGFCENQFTNNIMLRPKLSGSIEGDNYRVLGQDIGESDSNTIYYQDITNDSQAPADWEWDDITNLDCQLWGENFDVFNDRYIYIDAIYIRVTFTPPVIVVCNVIDITVTPLNIFIPGTTKTIELKSTIHKFFNLSSTINITVSKPSPLVKEINFKSNIQNHK